MRGMLDKWIGKACLWIAAAVVAATLFSYVFPVSTDKWMIPGDDSGITENGVPYYYDVACFGLSAGRIGVFEADLADDPMHSARGFSLPLLWLAPAFAVMGLAIHPKRRRPYPGRRCGKCDYDLRASSNRCPECGTLIARNTSTSL